jgi:hypothetical protein
MMPLKDILKGGVSAIYARELREAAADVAAKLAISLEAIETFKRTGALCDVVTYLIAAEKADAANRTISVPAIVPTEAPAL